MSTWSNRRKSLYALIAIIVLIVLVGVPAWKAFYTAPSCVDGAKNGDEQGVDCGGSCTKLCSSAFLDIPSPSWVRFKEIAPRLYNAAAYIVNPNPKAGARGLSYSLSVLDKEGLEIGRSTGKFNLPPGRNTLVFVGDLRITDTDQSPARMLLEFDRQPEWVPGIDTLINLSVTDKNYRESAFESSLDVTVSNRGPRPARNVIVYGILKDKDDNVIDFSKTVVDEIASQRTALAPFTWPYSHDGKVISLEVLAVPE